MAASTDSTLMVTMVGGAPGRPMQDAAVDPHFTRDARRR